MLKSLEQKRMPHGEAEEEAERLKNIISEEKAKNYDEAEKVLNKEEEAATHKFYEEFKRREGYSGITDEKMEYIYNRWLEMLKELYVMRDDIKSLESDRNSPRDRESFSNWSNNRKHTLDNLDKALVAAIDFMDHNRPHK